MTIRAIPNAVGSEWPRLAWYGIGAFAPLGTTLLLLPVYTRWLSESEFGSFVLITAAYGLFSAVTLLGLNSAVVREYYALTSTRDRRELVGAVTLLVSTVALALVTGLGALNGVASRIAYLVLGTADPRILAPLAGYFVFQNIYAVQLAAARAAGRAARFASIALVQSAALLAGVSIFVIGLDLGLRGFALTVCCAATVSAIAGMRISGTVPAWPSSWRRYLMPTLAFGIPLIAVNASGWALAALDRYLVNAFLGLENTGAYGLAYRLGSLANPLLLVPFAAMFPPAIFKRMSTDGFTPAARMVYQVHWAVVALAATLALGLSLAARPLLVAFGGNEYSYAAPVVRLVGWSFVFYASYHVMANIFALRRQTAVTASVVVGALVLNVATNLVALPRLGIVGAAVATLIAYSALAAVTGVLAYRLGRPRRDHIEQGSP